MLRKWHRLFTKGKIAPTTSPDKLFKNKHVEFVLVCIGTIKEVDQVFVCGEDQAFFESDGDLIKALVDLISAYYVFDVRYLQCISGVLHFLQEIVLLQSESEYKGTKFAPLWQSLKRGALSKLLFRKFNLNTFNNESKGAISILHY